MTTPEPQAVHAVPVDQATMASESAPPRGYSVFFGDVAIDEYYIAPYFPAGGDKVSVQTLEEQFGGMCANAASIFANYGIPTSFMSQLNSRALTQRLLTELTDAGISTKHVIFDEAVPDSKCIILLSGDQHIVIIPDLGITHTEISVDAFEHMANAEFLFTSQTDSIPFRMGEKRAQEIFRDLCDRGVKIVIDLDVYHLENHPSGLIEYCDILFMNSLGYERFRESGNDVQWLLQNRTTAIVVTKDSEGCDLYTRDGIESIPGYPVEPVDVTGAGDTFSSSFLYAYSTTKNLAEAARFANAAAALSIGTVGARAGKTDAATVHAFMAEQSERLELAIPSPTHTSQ
ncbi:carbohydrate kinase family protein [Microterricola gilva]|uniref:carbohydrate kinase family protein n=1 Tax=Microterricola gilva TaxID=393267 RepID=UPI001A92915C|nr:carbohydrate kinase family protein [Microterricola gilva]